jgi:hypothetical protein
MALDLEPVMAKRGLWCRVSREVIPDVLVLYRQLAVAAARALCDVDRQMPLVHIGVL